MTTVLLSISVHFNLFLYVLHNYNHTYLSHCLADLDVFWGSSLSILKVTVELVAHFETYKVAMLLFYDFFGGDINECLFIPERPPVADQKNDSTWV